MTGRWRSLLLALASLLALCLPARPAAAEDPPADNPADLAASWLLSQATDGVYHQPVGDGVDWGLTTDAIIGLLEVGVPAPEMAPLVAALTAAIADGSFAMMDMPEHTDGGQLAKGAVIALELGTDPRGFGGVDLIAQIQSRVSADRLDRGRPTSNIFGQSYAVMALSGAGEDVSGLVAQLLLQQCPAGDFRLGMADEQCSTGPERADRDATAIAIRALQSADTAPGAVEQAQRWLASDQAPDGSWVASAFQDVANTNTTGLAAHAVPDRAVRARAVRYITSVQLATGPDAGAVAYDRDAVERLVAGEVSAEQFQWQRATAQALLALAHFDVRTQPGTFRTDGAQWQTVCSRAGTGELCSASLWATTVTGGDGAWSAVTGWVPVVVTELPAISG